MLLLRGRRRRGRLLGMMGSKGGEKGEKSQDRWNPLVCERGPGRDRVTQRWSQDPREGFVSISVDGNGTGLLEFVRVLTLLDHCL